MLGRRLNRPTFGCYNSFGDWVRKERQEHCIGNRRYMKLILLSKLGYDNGRGLHTQLGIDESERHMGD